MPGGLGPRTLLTAVLSIDDDQVRRGRLIALGPAWWRTTNRTAHQRLVAVWAIASYMALAAAAVLALRRVEREAT
jgi:hypothetical protein